MSTKEKDTPEKKVLSLFGKLLEIQKASNYLQKENEGYQYSFVSSSQTLSHVKGLMNEQGLLLVPSITSQKVVEFKNNKDKIEFFTELDMVYTWINTENPEERLEVPFVGQGVDNTEKGIGKALTYSEKYFLLKFFHIATDKDDPDNHLSKDQLIEKVKIDLVDIKDVKGFETYGKEVMRDFKKFSRDIQPLLADKRKEFV